jgi:hypothetical protein
MGKNVSAHNTRHRIWAARSALASGEGHGNPVSRIGCPPEEMLKVTSLERAQKCLFPRCLCGGGNSNTTTDGFVPFFALGMSSHCS